MAKGSKNNPTNRDNNKLVVYCSECNKEIKVYVIVNCQGNKRTVYKCSNCEFEYPLYKGSYQDLRHEWIVSK